MGLYGLYEFLDWPDRIDCIHNYLLHMVELGLEPSTDDQPSNSFKLSDRQYCRRNQILIMNKVQQSKEKWLANGAPLSMEPELLKIRENIRLKNRHKGERLIMVKAAYNEMRTRMSKRKKDLNCGSRCMNDVNRQLNIWFALYDKRSDAQKRLAAQDLAGEHEATTLEDALSGVGANDSLVTLDSSRAILDEMDYHELDDKLKKAIGIQKYADLKKENGNCLIKRTVIIENLLNT